MNSARLLMCVVLFPATLNNNVLCGLMNNIYGLRFSIRFASVEIVKVRTSPDTFFRKSRLTKIKRNECKSKQMLADVMKAFFISL